MGAGASTKNFKGSPLVTHMHQLFLKYDVDKSGALDWTEFYKVLDDLNIGLTPDEIAEWQEYADVDRSGTIKWSEFEPVAQEIFKKFYGNKSGAQGKNEAAESAAAGGGKNPKSLLRCKDSMGNVYELDTKNGLSKYKRTRPSPLVAHMKQLFQAHDVDHSGSLSWEEFHQVLEELNLGLSQDESWAWQEQVDADHSGHVEWKEFEPLANWLTKEFFAKRQKRHGAKDPWVTMKTPQTGHEYRLNMNTGETEWINAYGQHGIDLSKYDDFEASKFTLDQSPELRDYLVNEYHAHCGKDEVLEWEEFWRFIHGIELGLSDTCIAELRQKADTNMDGYVDWMEMLVVVEPLLGKFWRAKLDGAPEYDQWTQLHWETHHTVERTKNGRMKTGRAFYVNKMTGESAWVEPACFQDEGFKNRKKERALAHPPSLDEYLANAFRRQDKDHSDTLNAVELRRVISQELHMVPALTPAEINKMMQDGDKNRDGQLNWKEFVSVVRPKLEKIFHERTEAKEWVAMKDFDVDGHEYLYWYNRTTGESQWEKPDSA